MLRLAFYGLLCGFVALLALVIGVAWWALPQLPPTERLQDVRFQTPLKVYTRDGSLIAEFGEKRRTPVAIEDVPVRVRQAFIAAEDDRFYSHPGVDWVALVRAALNLVQSRERTQGGSTITMQVARNFFLSREKTFQRKLKEIVLAIKIERELSKDQILELYLNKIFLGHRAYGVAAAAQVYFGSTLESLTLPEAAMIAGLPKAPSRLNPVADPRAARDRRAYVLRRMRELGYIEEAEYQAALNAPLTARLHGQPVETSAPHLAEMVRDEMVRRHGDAAYTRGFRVFTTVTSELQYAAVKALRDTINTYDLRHGYRGPEAHVTLEDTPEAAWPELLNPYQPVGELQPVVVVAVGEREFTALDARGTRLAIPWEGMQWARTWLGPDQIGRAPTQAADLVKPGDIVRVRWSPPPDAPTEVGGKTATGFWRLAQIPNVEGALVSLDTSDGAILALVGGYEFALSKFNRATQAKRQPGSNFKPFIYSAALDNGFTPASYINDAPIVFSAPGLDEAWRPENYSGTYYGPTRLRDALANSRNLVSIRMMREIGIDKTIAHVSRFGFDPRNLPRNLSLSLGTGELTPLQLVTGYAVFANGGFLVEPYFIDRIENAEGAAIWTATPKVACADCETALAADGEPVDLAAMTAGGDTRPPALAPRVIDAQNAWLMYSMMKDVITRGTGRRALELKRSDLAGKTGTTNDLKDAWFSGFNTRIATTTWVGSDESLTLGPQETGARTALPMWIDYMRVALRDVPARDPVLPAGLVTVRVGTAAGGKAQYETFRAEDAPGAGGQIGTRSPAADLPSAVEQLF